jgi:hypothetical protein
MNEKQPLDNAPLGGMIFTGMALLAVGVIVWVVNTNVETEVLYADVERSNPEGQFVGTAMGAAGLLLVALGWAAAAICRQIVDVAQKSKAPD